MFKKIKILVITKVKIKKHHIKCILWSLMTFKKRKSCFFPIVKELVEFGNSKKDIKINYNFKLKTDLL